MTTHSQSSHFGYMFEGVEMPKGTAMTERTVLAYICETWMKMMDKIGWFEHTADWDLHAEIHLYDGREVHSDGSYLTVDRNGGPDLDEQTVYATAEGHTHILLEDVNVYDDDEPGTRSLFNEYVIKQEQPDGGQDLMGTLRIPLDQIESIHVGWCS